jgi:general secretion pathway protein L
VGRVRAVLATVLGIVVVIAGLSAGANFVIGGNLQADQQDLVRKLDAHRASMRAGRDANASLATGPERALERRKHASGAAVIVLEALATILPDHTYVTELRIEGDRLRLIGISRDVPSLIRLIEQSQNFTRATFFAPTTRSPADPGERFHIEAHIQPVFEKS